VQQQAVWQRSTPWPQLSRHTSKLLPQTGRGNVCSQAVLPPQQCSNSSSLQCRRVRAVGGGRGVSWRGIVWPAGLWCEFLQGPECVWPYCRASWKDWNSFLYLVRHACTYKQ
jgi:hypothetical protein